jgi:beta-glucanase (GH16 family)
MDGIMSRFRFEQHCFSATGSQVGIGLDKKPKISLKQRDPRRWNTFLFLNTLLVLFSSSVFASSQPHELPDREWQIISLPYDPGNNNSLHDLFGDDISGEYGKKWVVYEYNPAKKAYDKKGINSVLKPGKGYWITQITGSRVQLDMPEGSTSVTSARLSSPPQGAKAAWNLIGFSLGTPKAFRDLRVKSSTGICVDTPCDLAKASKNNILSDKLWRYTKGENQHYEVVSRDGLLEPWEGFFVAALKNASQIAPLTLIASASQDPDLSSSQVGRASSPPIAGDWTLTFFDDFNGTTLDPKKWRQGKHHLDLAGQAGNSGKHASVKNGSLQLLAEKKPITFAGQEYQYSTGEISTFKKFRQRYGYFEARIKYDAIVGVWPAFWLMPNRSSDYSESRTSHSDNDRTPLNDFEAHKRQSFLRFPTKAIRGPVSSAALKIRVKKINSERTLGNVSIHKVLSDNWDENTINWTNRPEFDPVWLAQFTRPADGSRGLVKEFWPGKELTVDVTDYINERIAANGDASFALVDSFSRENHITFGSREATNANDQPRLVIDGSTYIASGDAYVNGGANASSNFGSEPELGVEDAWEITSKIDAGGMEFDIMETVGAWGENAVQHALHWENYKRNHPKKETGPLDMIPTDDDYHTYGMYWKEGYVEFYIDGKATMSWKSSRVGSIESYIILSHQMGGWGVNRNITADFSSAMMSVDYVRVWK